MHAFLELHKKHSETQHDMGTSYKQDTARL